MGVGAGPAGRAGLGDGLGEGLEPAGLEATLGDGLGDGLAVAVVGAGPGDWLGLAEMVPVGVPASAGVTEMVALAIASPSTPTSTFHIPLTAFPCEWLPPPCEAHVKGLPTYQFLAGRMENGLDKKW